MSSAGCKTLLQNTGCKDMKKISFTQVLTETQWDKGKNIILIPYTQRGLFSQAPTKQPQAMK